MRILVLGGTGLSGTALVLQALARAHDVVAVHRGRTDTFDGADEPRLRQLVHDRADGHAALGALGRFDAVVDVSARIPAWSADAVRELDAGETWWVQYSSVSAYADQSSPGPREDDALAAFDDAELEQRLCEDPRADFSYDWYSPAKATCERLLVDAVGERATILRPVLITGAHDDTWRVPYWVERIARGGTALAPPAADPVQVVDARDLADFALDCLEQRLVGAFNVAPVRASTVGDLLAACVEVVAAAGDVPATVVHAGADFLDANGVEPWSELPAWIPLGVGYDAMVTADPRRAAAAGLRSRPLAETMSDVLDWIRAGAERRDRGSGSGLAAPREAELLTALAAGHPA